MLGVAIFLFGLYALIAGKIKISASFQLEGWRARGTGAFFAAPLPLSFLIGIGIGILAHARVIAMPGKAALAGMEIVTNLLGLGGGIAFALLTKPKTADPPPPSSR